MYNFSQALEAAQEAYPELRIGQILVNARRLAGHADLFYVTDEDLTAAIWLFVGQKSNG